MTDEQYGALQRIVKEVEEKRQAKCMFIDCVVNHRIGENDIELVKDFLKSQADRHDRIESSWHIEDIRSLEEQSEEYGSEKFEPLTDKECREVLQRVNGGHDATIGINWDMLQYHIDAVREKRKLR